MREIASSELVDCRDGMILVDIRQPSEWQTTGVIEGCHLLTFPEHNVEGWLTSLGEFAAPEDELVLVCRTGHRTGILLDFLNSQTPYRRARHLSDGILGWIGNGYPVIGYPGSPAERG